MNAEFTKEFVEGWLRAWNSHDLDRILSHYADDFEMTSPMIAQLTTQGSGTLRGKAAVGAYWKKALALLPDLQFELIEALGGIDSIAIYYKGARERHALEVFIFDASGKVAKAMAHY